MTYVKLCTDTEYICLQEPMLSSVNMGDIYTFHMLINTMGVPSYALKRKDSEQHITNYWENTDEWQNFLKGMHIIPKHYVSDEDLMLMALGDKNTIDTVLNTINMDKLPVREEDSVCKK